MKISQFWVLLVLMLFKAYGGCFYSSQSHTTQSPWNKPSELKPLNSEENGPDSEYINKRYEVSLPLIWPEKHPEVYLYIQLGPGRPGCFTIIEKM